MRAFLCALFVLSSLLMARAAHAQTATDVFAERSLAIVIDDRCSMFSDRERNTLTASWLQSRGTLLRSGYSAEDIRSTFETIVRRAANQPCDSEATLGLIAGVRGAFELFSRLPALDYPGQARLWSAVRRRDEYPVWTLSQTIANEVDAPRFGLYSDASGERLTLSLPTTPAPASVVLVIRDVEVAANPYDPTLGGLLSVTDRPEWARLAPPPHAQSRIWASNRRIVEERLFFGFPETATQALAMLDPREAVRLELYDARGEMTGQYYVEIGDFAAGTAFLAAGHIYLTSPGG